LANLTELIQQALDKVMSELHVCMPGRIILFEESTRKARVQPLLNRTYQDGTSQPMPIISGVPVLRMMGAGRQASLDMPVLPGDGCLILFADRSMDNWLSSGGSVLPDDKRKHSLSDAIAIVGLEPFNVTGPAEDNVNVKLKNFLSELVLTPSGQFNLKGSAGDLLSQISDALDKCADMALAASTHTHPTAVGPSGPPTNATDFVQVQIALLAIKAIIDLLKAG
jgi:hypothetical protein